MAATTVYVDSEWQIFENIFYGRFIYSQSFCWKSAERKSPKKYCFFFIFRFDAWSGIRTRALRWISQYTIHWTTATICVIILNNSVISWCRHITRNAEYYNFWDSCVWKEYKNKITYATCYAGAEKFFSKLISVVLWTNVH